MWNNKTGEMCKPLNIIVVFLVFFPAINATFTFICYVGEICLTLFLCNCKS